MVNLKAQYAEIKTEVEQGLAQTIENCSFILGPNVQAFEKECADYLGVKHAIGVASGTDALHLALIAEGIGAGDEVIMPAFTFVASFEAVLSVGAIPVLVDIDETLTLDPAAVKAAITPKTKAIILNSPSNPAGSVVSAEDLERIVHLAGLSLEAHVDERFLAEERWQLLRNRSDAAEARLEPHLEILGQARHQTQRSSPRGTRPAGW